MVANLRIISTKGLLRIGVFSIVLGQNIYRYRADLVQTRTIRHTVHFVLDARVLWWLPGTPEWSLYLEILCQASLCLSRPQCFNWTALLRLFFDQNLCLNNRSSTPFDGGHPSGRVRWRHIGENVHEYFKQALRWAMSTDMVKSSARPVLKNAICRVLCRDDRLCIFSTSKSKFGLLKPSISSLLSEYLNLVFKRCFFFSQSRRNVG